MNEAKDKELERLEAELRKLPQPPVPVGLEAKLLAVIPKRIARVSRLRIRWVGVAAVAAGLIFAFGLYLFHGQTKPVARLATVDIEQTLRREAISARLNAAARILAAQPGGKKIADETYRYLAQTYPDTTVGKQLSMWRNKQ